MCAVTAPATKAIVPAQTTRTSVMTRLALNRGTMRKSIGSAAHIRSASICSVTTLQPAGAPRPPPPANAVVERPAKPRVELARAVGEVDPRRAELEERPRVRPLPRLVERFVHGVHARRKLMT